MNASTRLSIITAAALCTGVLGGGVAFASWFESSPESKIKKIRTVAMPTFDSGPAVELKNGNVKVDWIAQKIVKGVPVESYIVTRYNTVTEVGARVCGDSVTTTKCTDTAVPVGKWKYTVRTVFGEWRGAESTRSDRITMVTAPAIPTAGLAAESPPDVAPLPPTAIQNASAPATTAPAATEPATPEAVTAPPPPPVGSSPAPAPTLSTAQEPSPDGDPVDSGALDTPQQ